MNKICRKLGNFKILIKPYNYPFIKYHYKITCHKTKTKNKVKIKMYCCQYFDLVNIDVE